MGLRSTFGNISRLSDISQVLVKYGFKQLLTEIGITRRFLPRSKRKQAALLRGLRGRERAKAFRRALEELGPTFIKLGQFLAQRQDILPVEYTQELSRLQERVTPVAFEQIRDIIVRELGPIDRLFSDIDETPLAVASISQVHKARLPDGKQVVIKVKKPGIDEQIAKDITLLRTLAWHVEHSTLLKTGGVYATVLQMTRSLKGETDFLVEASHADVYRDYFDEQFAIPRVYWQATTSHVITMEYVSGYTFDELPADLREEKGHAIAAAVVRLFYEQVFFMGMLHTDLHKGNMRITGQGRLVIYDFGQTLLIPQDLVSRIVEILYSVRNQHYQRLMRVILKLTGHTGRLPGWRQDFLLQDIRDFTGKYYNVPMKRLDLGAIMDELFDHLRTHGLAIPHQVAVMAKATAYVDEMVKELAPDTNVFEPAQEYISRYISRRLQPKRLAVGGMYQAVDIARAMRRMPAALDGALDFATTLDERVNTFNQGFFKLVGLFKQSITSVCLSIVVAALIISSSIIINGYGSSAGQSIPFLALLGYALAMVLGIGLIVTLVRKHSSSLKKEDRE